jgi:hypothetical protein
MKRQRRKACSAHRDAFEMLRRRLQRRSPDFGRQLLRHWLMEAVSVCSYSPALPQAMLALVHIDHHDRYELDREAPL